MKIFYAVQATGNGHIARAIEILPFLEQYGTVDVFLSGSNSSLQSKLPVKFRSKGISLYYSPSGGLDYLKMYREFNIKKIWKEAKDLPVEKYDLVINDFESITAIACKRKKVASINFGHQASFQSDKSPRPDRKNWAGEWILKNYAPAKAYVGLHFRQYDDFIFNPIIKSDILNALPVSKDYITVYLPQFPDSLLASYFKQIKETRFEIFSKTAACLKTEGNITYIPINNSAFNESLINCYGIITGGGFETPAEALYLGKKLMCIPIQGQYEQKCNAKAAMSFGVSVIEKIGSDFSREIIQWLSAPHPEKLQLTHSTPQIIAQVVEKAKHLNF